MKKLFAIFLALVIISQTMVNVGIGIYYHLNKEYISKQLCENRNNPLMHCNGHCYLSKQLQKAEQNEKRSTQFVKEKDEVLTNETRGTLVKYFPVFRENQFVSYNSSLYLTDNSNTLLKPPAA